MLSYSSKSFCRINPAICFPATQEQFSAKHASSSAAGESKSTRSTSTFISSASTYIINRIIRYLFSDPQSHHLIFLDHMALSRNRISKPIALFLKFMLCIDLNHLTAKNCRTLSHSGGGLLFLSSPFPFSLMAATFHSLQFHSRKLPVSKNTKNPAEGTFCRVLVFPFT